MSQLRRLEAEGQNEISRCVLDSGEQVYQEHAEAVVDEGVIEIVELAGVAGQVAGRTRKLFHDGLLSELPELLAQHQVHEGTDQRLRLVLQGLHVQDGAVEELHELSEVGVGGGLDVLEADCWEVAEKRVAAGGQLHLYEGIPLSHDAVGEIVKRGRVDLELEYLYIERGTSMVILISSS